METSFDRLDAFVENSIACGGSPEGVESEWLPVATLRLDGGALALMDTYTQNGPVVDLSSGDYTISVKARVWNAADFCVSQMRVLPLADAGKRGVKVGEIGVDLAMVSACDWKRFVRTRNLLGDVAWGDRDEDDTLVGVLPFGVNGEDALFWVTSGFGDGTYPVYELLAGSNRVGVEVVFLEQDEDPFSLHQMQAVLSDEQRSWQLNLF